MNKIIDLGYFSMRYTHSRRTPTSTFLPEMGFGSSLPIMLGYMKDIRDRYRYALHNINDGKDWSVGRVFAWQGQTNYYAYGFKVSKLDGFGAPTDYEFLVLYSGPSQNNSARAALSNVFSDWASYFYAAASTSFIGFHYNYKATLDTYAIGAGADGDAPTVNPYVDAAAFFPDPITQGVPFIRGWAATDLTTGNSAYGQYNWTHCVVVNHTTPFLSFYINHHNGVRVRYGCVLGNILIPKSPSDTRTEGVFKFETENSNQTSAWVLAVDPSVNLEAVYQIRTPASQEYNVVSAGFADLNQPRYDGTFDRDRVSVHNLTNIKGWLDDEIIAIQAPAIGYQYNSVDPNTHHGSTFESVHGRLIKLLGDIVVPWAEGQSPPFSGWPKYPQKIIKE